MNILEIILIIYLVGVLASYLVYRSALHFIETKFPNSFLEIKNEKDCLIALFKKKDSFWIFLIFSWFGVLIAIILNLLEEEKFMKITFKSFKTIKR